MTLLLVLTLTTADTFIPRTAQRSRRSALRRGAGIMSRMRLGCLKIKQMLFFPPDLEIAIYYDNKDQVKIRWQVGWDVCLWAVIARGKGKLLGRRKKKEINFKYKVTICKVLIQFFFFNLGREEERERVNCIFIFIFIFISFGEVWRLGLFGGGWGVGWMMDKMIFKSLPVVGLAFSYGHESD